MVVRRTIKRYEWDSGTVSVCREREDSAETVEEDNMAVKTTGNPQREELKQKFVDRLHQLQQAFRARLRRTAMEEFSAMRIEYAAQLLARGASPGEVAAQMGYCSGAYFSQKFRAATGHTPSAYRRIQQGLPAKRQNRQQKDKAESKTSIAEPPQKK